MTILDVRGTHGSGKTTAVRSLFKGGRDEILGHFGGREKIIGYSIKDLDCAVVGPYKDGVASGGCDCIPNVAEVCSTLEILSKDYKFVVLEGIMVSHTFQRYSDLANIYDDYRFLFLDTPLVKCKAHVLKRRREKGNLKEPNFSNLIKDHKNIWGSVRHKMIDAGHDVGVLNWRHAQRQLREQFNV